MEMVGEEKMRKETELDQLYQAHKVYEIDHVEAVIELLEKEHWQKRKKYLELRMIQGLSSGLCIGNTIIAFHLISAPLSKKKVCTLLEMKK